MNGREEWGVCGKVVAVEKGGMGASGGEWWGWEER